MKVEFSDDQILGEAAAIIMRLPTEKTMSLAARVRDAVLVLEELQRLIILSRGQK